MNRLYNGAAAALHYVFVNKDKRHQTLANGFLYLGPHCVFKETQVLQKKIEQNLLHTTRGDYSLDDRVINLTTLLSGGGINHTDQQPLAKAVYIKRFAIGVDFGMVPNKGDLQVFLKER